MKRTREEILSDIAYEKRKGIHTYNMCSCGRKGCRNKCLLCLNEELSKLNEN